MAEEVDAQRQAFMDELGMTYVELEEAAGISRAIQVRAYFTEGLCIVHHTKLR